MKIRLFIDSDTCLEFPSRAKAFVYADKHNLTKYAVLTEYNDGRLSQKNYSVFNNLASKLENCITYYKSEKEAFHFIGSVLS